MNQFTLDDLLINIVPGGLIIFTFLYLTNSLTYLTSSESLLAVGLFIMVSFTLIEVSTTLSDQPNWYPDLFETTILRIQDYGGDDPEDTKSHSRLSKFLDFISIGEMEMTKCKLEFWYIAKDKWDLDDGFSEYIELYRLVMHSLDPLNRRTQRPHRLYLFYRNLAVSSMVVYLMFLFSLGTVIGELSISIMSKIATALLILTITTALFVMVFWHFGDDLVEQSRNL